MRCLFCLTKRCFCHGAFLPGHQEWCASLGEHWIGRLRPGAGLSPTGPQMIRPAVQRPGF